MDILELVGRKKPLFSVDIKTRELELTELISGSQILVVGAAGSIGQSVTIELMKRDPKLLYAVDISENNLVELVRMIRSSIGYNKCEFKTFAVSCGSHEFDALCSSGPTFDYIFNLSAMKHVRSEKDPFTLMRLIRTNIFNTMELLKVADNHKTKNYFCVSTDKAANPVNMMGASKRIMEKYLFSYSGNTRVSLARFANVAFSDGSLLHGFNKRFMNKQPITAPSDVKRYFVSAQEAGELCMLAGLLGGHRDIFFPKLNQELHLETFSTIAIRFLEDLGYKPHICDSEEEARDSCANLIQVKRWPVYFFTSDTTGEKSFEEFYTCKERINFSSFSDIGIISNSSYESVDRLREFEQAIAKIRLDDAEAKEKIVSAFETLVPEFQHIELGKNLDQRM